MNNNYILNELKKIKGVFDNQKKYEYKTVKGWIRDFGLLLIILTLFLIDLEHAKYNWPYLVAIIIAVSIVLYIKIFKGVSSIEINETKLIIKYSNNVIEYDLKEIEEIKYNPINRRKSLYIKNKDKNDLHSIYFYDATRIIALIILIKYIKQDNLNAIDTITEEEIDKIKNEIIN